MKAERRKELWQEPLPGVELADRLRRVALFDFTHVDELFRLARLGRQIRYETGRAIYQRGEAVTSIQFLLDGLVTLDDQAVKAPAAIGFESLLEGSPMPHTVVAAERSITLALSADEFLALLSENVELAEGIFRMLIATRGFGEGHTLIRGTLPPDMKDSAHLGGVDRALLLQSSPLLAHATAAQIWRLSAIARDKTVAAGAEAIARGGDPAIIVVLSGALSVEGSGQSGTATAGDIVGLYETLAGSRFDAVVTAKTEAKILRIDRAGLFELLADHTDLLQGVFSILLRRSGTTISNTVSTP
jgi:CRP-like cAMP-binding protein